MPSLWFWLLKEPNIFKGQKHFFSKSFPNNFFYVKNFKNFDPIKIKWTRTRIRKGWKLGTITRGATTLSITTFSITTISMTLNKLRHSAYWHSILSAEYHLSWMSFMLSFPNKPVCTEFHYAECCYAECLSASLGRWHCQFRVYAPSLAYFQRDHSTNIEKVWVR